MPNLKRYLLVIFFVFSFVASLFAGGFSSMRSIGPFNDFPGPQLLYPVRENIELTGKDFLEFKWLNDYSSTDHFIFKIYTGYNMYTTGLVYKQDVPSNASSVAIKSGLFQDGQVYTWAVVRVTLAGYKSDKSSSSFTVIKK